MADTFTIHDSETDGELLTDHEADDSSTWTCVEGANTAIINPSGTVTSPGNAETTCVNSTTFTSSQEYFFQASLLLTNLPFRPMGLSVEATSSSQGFPFYLSPATGSAFWHDPGPGNPIPFLPASGQGSATTLVRVSRTIVGGNSVYSAYLVNADGVLALASRKTGSTAPSGATGVGLVFPNANGTASSVGWQAASYDVVTPFMTSRFFVAATAGLAYLQANSTYTIKVYVIDGFWTNSTTFSGSSGTVTNVSVNESEQSATLTIAPTVGNTTYTLTASDGSTISSHCNNSGSGLQTFGDNLTAIPSPAGVYVDYGGFANGAGPVTRTLFRASTVPVRGVVLSASNATQIASDTSSTYFLDTGASATAPNYYQLTLTDGSTTAYSTWGNSGANSMTVAYGRKLAGSILHVFLGDSITFGAVADTFDLAAAYQFARQAILADSTHAISYSDFGSSGTDTSAWLPVNGGLLEGSIAQALEIAPAATIYAHIALGVNDALAPASGTATTAAQYRANILAICNYAISQGCVPVLHAPTFVALNTNQADGIGPDIDNFMWSYRLALQSIAAGSAGAILAGAMDTLDRFGTDPSQLSGGLHPTATGHAFLGAAWYQGWAQAAGSASVAAGYTDPGIAHVQSGVAYQYAGSTETGTYDPVTGNYTDPGVSHVQASTTYRFAGSTETGTYAPAGGVYPSPSDVRLATVYGPTSNETGTLHVPAAAQVLSGVAVDATTGTVALPTAAEVLSGTSFGPGSGTAGTVVQASTADVRSGTAYGPGSGLTGSCHVPGASSVLSGVAVDATTGTVVLPDANQVELGVTFGPGMGSTGSYSGGGTSLTLATGTVVSAPAPTPTTFTASGLTGGTGDYNLMSAYFQSGALDGVRRQVLTSTRRGGVVDIVLACSPSPALPVTGAVPLPPAPSTAPGDGDTVLFG